jgi:hypothetical protein
VRAWISVGLGVVLLAGCQPTATVQRTTPVANLQPYRGLIVRGTRAGGRRMGRLATMLEHAAVARIRNHCAFLDVHPASESDQGGPDDLYLDVTVQRAFRGGIGIIQNESQATVDVKLVLSDGADQELIGAADIRGQSAGIVVGQETPEEEAINAVADSIAQILVRSGCTGPRVARVRPTVHRPGQDQDPGETDPGGDEPGEDPGSVELVSDGSGGAMAKAEKENEEGKRLFRSADVAGAKTHFLAAIKLQRDPRFVFNLCLAEEALNSLDAAVSTCKSVMGMKPDRALADKVKLRLKILSEKQGQRN